MRIKDIMHALVLIVFVLTPFARVHSSSSYDGTWYLSIRNMESDDWETLEEFPHLVVSGNYAELHLYVSDYNTKTVYTTHSAKVKDPCAIMRDRFQGLGAQDDTLYVELLGVETFVVEDRTAKLFYDDIYLKLTRTHDEWSWPDGVLVGYSIIHGRTVVKPSYTHPDGITRDFRFDNLTLAFPPGYCFEEGLTTDADTEQAGTITDVSLQYSEIDLFQGENIQLNVEISPSDAPNRNVRWDSSNDHVVRVDSNGRLTSMNPGTSTITVTAEDGGLQNSCNVRVIPWIEDIRITTDEELLTTEDNEGNWVSYYEVGLHETIYFDIEIETIDGDILSFREMPLKAVSTNPDVAALSVNGNLSALNEGWAAVYLQIETYGKELKTSSMNIYVSGSPHRITTPEERDLLHPVEPDVPFEVTPRGDDWRPEGARKTAEQIQSLVEKTLDYIFPRVTSATRAVKEFLDGNYVNATKNLILMTLGRLATAADQALSYSLGDDYAEDYFDEFRERIPYPVGPPEPVPPRDDIPIQDPIPEPHR